MQAIRQKDRLEAELLRQLELLLGEQLIYVGSGAKMLDSTEHKDEQNALDELRDLVNNEKSMFATRGLGP